MVYFLGIGWLNIFSRAGSTEVVGTESFTCAFVLDDIKLKPSQSVKLVQILCIRFLSFARQINGIN